RFYRVNTSPEQVVGILTRAVDGVEVEALPGTSSIVVRATAAQHDRVATVLAQFDTSAERVSLEQRTYFLSNANATDLAGVLAATGVVASGSENADGTT